MASPANDAHPLKPSYKFLVSACLAGINCTYNGRNKLKRGIKKLVASRLALPACPEILGGLGVPRENSEISGGDGGDVLNKKAKIIAISGKDLSRHYIKGACATLRLIKKHGIKKAILKSKSPSCGVGMIYDGTFKKVLKRGDGVTASLLKRNGVRVSSR